MMRLASGMDNSPESITAAVRALRERTGFSMAVVAKSMGYKNASSYQRYESPADYPGGYLKRDLVEKLAKVFVGRGSPPIRAEDVWALAGPEFQPPGKPFTTFDPDQPEPPASDDPMTQGEHTGVRGIPEGSTPQLDVTAGMGGGGLTVIHEGVPGKNGMAFAAESISDWWRVPPAVLVAMGTNIKPTDITFIPVQGDSMAPTLIEGDVVVVDTRHRWPSPDGLYALNDQFGGVIVKRLEVVSMPGEEEPRVSVISDNPKHPAKTWGMSDLRIVGRVLRKFGHVL